jgi:protein ImuB
VVGGLSGVLLEDWRLVRELFPASRSGPAVVAVDRGAWELGVRPGLPLAEARSLARPVAGRGVKSVVGGGAAGPLAVQFEEWRPEEDRRELEELALIARRFAPVVALDSLPLPDSLLLDITGCEHLFGGEAELAEELLGELWGAGLRGVAGIGGRVSTAWAMAHWDPTDAELRGFLGQSGMSERLGVLGVSGGLGTGKAFGAASWRVRRLPRGEDRPWLDVLPITAGRLPLSDVEILRDLGVLQLGRLLNLPREDLPARLSAVAVERVQQLRGVLSESLVNLPEANPIVAEWSEEQPASGLRDLHWVLGRLSELVSGELVRRRQMCGGVECELKLGSGEWLQFGAGLVRPTQDAGLLGEVSSLRLEYLLSDEQRRIAAGVGSVAAGAAVAGAAVAGATEAAGVGVGVGVEGFLRLVVEPVVLLRMRALSAQLPPARQRNLFGELQDVSEPVEQLAALVSRLTGRLGRERVLRVGERADVRPEYSVRVEPLPDAVQAGGAGAAERALWNLAGLSGAGAGAGAGTGVKSGRGAVVVREGALQDCDGVLPRPLRLLEPAVDVTAGLLREGEVGVVDRSPLLWREQLRRVPVVVAEGQRWEVEWWSGAERLQTAWWTERSCQRDYHVVGVRGGGRLWLYRDLTTGRWYLQGVFD